MGFAWAVRSYVEDVWPYNEWSDAVVIAVDCPACGQPAPWRCTVIRSDRCPDWAMDEYGAWIFRRRPHVDRATASGITPWEDAGPAPDRAPSAWVPIAAVSR